jgi:hypothetical protein
LLYICGRITLTFYRMPLGRELPNKTGKPHEVHDSKKRPPLPDHHFGIRGNKVGPLRRNRANRAVVDAQQKALAGPVIAFADTDELPPGERMEGMGYTHKLRRSDSQACILS